MKYTLTLFLFAGMLASLIAQPGVPTNNKKKGIALPAGVSVERDLVYRVVEGSPPLLLDLYRQKDADGLLPVVVWVHGGGWKNGSKNKCQASWLASNGFAVASINYRLTDAAQWPAQIEDCQEAVRWLRKNATKYGLNPDYIGAWGSSAGGHLVALMGTRPLEDEAGQIQAVCDWYGPSELMTMPPNNIGNGRTAEDVAKSNGALLLGATVREVPDLAADASALDQVSADDPPFLIMHGSADPGVPLSQSTKLHEKLRASGVDSTLHIVEGAGHGGPEFKTEAVRDLVQAFFERTLKPTAQ